ncbi:MAG: cytochrome c1 [Alphaproteobacteria bacterium]|nr:cytochrome c1 [Alphaproteobacteria bacterium]
MKIRSMLATAGLLLAALAAPALASESEVALKTAEWSFDGPFGTYDAAQIRRGFQVYKDVCAACHSLKYVSYRNLSGPQGPFHTPADPKLGEDAVKALIDGIEVPDLDDAGEPITRQARLSDPFRSPFANEKAARAANNGANPPDLSVMVKARAGGADYLYSILTGYEEAPGDVVMQPGMSYNRFFAGHQIGMPQPIVSDDQVTYTEPGAPKASVDQMARDVTAFLAWASEPHMEERKRMGLSVLLFLAFLAALLYLSYQRIWADVEH